MTLDELERMASNGCDAELLIAARLYIPDLIAVARAAARWKRSQDALKRFGSAAVAEADSAESELCDTLDKLEEDQNDT